MFPCCYCFLVMWCKSVDTGTTTDFPSMLDLPIPAICPTPRNSVGSKTGIMCIKHSALADLCSHRWIFLNITTNATNNYPRGVTSIVKTWDVHAFKSTKPCRYFPIKCICICLHRSTVFVKGKCLCRLWDSRKEKGNGCHQQSCRCFHLWVSRNHASILLHTLVN